MDEALLIEIAQRRRKLEDCLETVDLILTATETLELEDLAELIPDNYDTMEDLREEIETRSDACREDMNAMADALRKVQP